jgi:hypothetical protein
MNARRIAPPAARPAAARTSLAFGAVLWVVSGVGFEAQAQGGTLDAPMHPIDRITSTPSRCVKCPQADAKDPVSPHVAERTAPEYQGPPRTGPEMELPEGSVGADLLDAGSVRIQLPLR